jgi:hypothetical protein
MASTKLEQQRRRENGGSANYIWEGGQARHVVRLVGGLRLVCT